jgi:hypothetical protein
VPHYALVAPSIKAFKVLLEAPYRPGHLKNSALITVDLTKAVADEAIARKDSIIIAYRKELLIRMSQSFSLARSFLVLSSPKRLFPSQVQNVLNLQQVLRYSTSNMSSRLIFLRSHHFPSFESDYTEQHSTKHSIATCPGGHQCLQPPHSFGCR